VITILTSVKLVPMVCGLCGCGLCGLLTVSVRVSMRIMRKSAYCWC